MNARYSLLLLALVASTAAQSSITILNSCTSKVSVCGAGGGFIYDLAPGASKTNQPSGPYNQCGSVQAEVNLDGFDGQNCYDLSEVAFKQNGVAVSLRASNGPTLTCSSSPCSDASQSGGAPKVTCVRGPATVTLQFCPSGSGTQPTAVQPTNSNSVSPSISSQAPTAAPSSSVNRPTSSQAPTAAPSSSVNPPTSSQAPTAAPSSSVNPRTSSQAPTGTPSSTTGGSTLTIRNNCPNQIDICGAGGGFIYNLAAGASKINQPSGPYNQCGSVQAEVNLSGYDNQDCFDLSEVAFKQTGVPITLYSSSGQRLTCTTSPCASASQAGGAPKVTCARGPNSIVLQFC